MIEPQWIAPAVSLLVLASALLVILMSSGGDKNEWPH